MDCLKCAAKTCRSGTGCGAETFTRDDIRSEYTEPGSQEILQAAASLVDNGRAGTLSRIEEIMEFARKMQYRKIGLAYCYGMENDARAVRELFRQHGLNLSGISCTVGGIAQDEINQQSCIHKVSCNPIGQATQLNEEGVDFVIIMGICLGHDILLQRNLKADFTTFVVKDRIFRHNPLEGVKGSQVSKEENG